MVGRAGRALGILLAALGLSAAAGWLVRPYLVPTWGPGGRLDLVAAVTTASAWLLLGCAAWLVLAVTESLVVAARSVLRPDRPASRRGCALAPPWVQRVVALLLGAGLVGGAAVPTGAAAVPDGRGQGERRLQGLALPDRVEGRSGSGPAGERPSSSEGAAPVRAQEPGAVVVVRRGDSLWTVTARRLGPEPSPAAVDRGWRRLYDLNLRVVGEDPDLILPGTRLAALPTAVVDRLRKDA